MATDSRATASRKRCATASATRCSSVRSTARPRIPNWWIAARTQGDVGAAGAQPGCVQAALQRWEQPLLVFHAETQRHRGYTVGGHGVAHLEAGATADFVAAHLEADVHEEPVSLVTSLPGQADERVARASKHRDTHVFEVDRQLRDALENHMLRQWLLRAWGESWGDAPTDRCPDLHRHPLRGGRGPDRSRRRGFTNRCLPWSGPPAKWSRPARDSTSSVRPQTPSSTWWCRGRACGRLRGRPGPL